jgi:hypothetical protein
MMTLSQIKTCSLRWDESDYYDENFPFYEIESFAAEEFDVFVQQFEMILFSLSRSGAFLVEAKNLGWRKLSGHMDVDASSASDFISKVFPRTQEWSLTGNFDQLSGCLILTLYHHDSPCGETYKVMARP